MGKQVESTKRSNAAGKFSTSVRATLDVKTGMDSPGPLAYQRASIGLRTVARKRDAIRPSTAGMGTNRRFFDSSDALRKQAPGPGRYTLPTSIGGTAPHLKSLPVFAFGKNEVVRNQLATGCSPGAVYKVYDGLAKQVEACRPSTPAFGFGTASRFPDASKADRQAHRDYVRHMRKSAMQRQRPQSAASILSGA